MQVLMKYRERRYGLILHLRRAMFVAPRFTAHMHGKEISVKVARCKTRVAGDAKIANLTDWSILVMDPKPPFENNGRGKCVDGTSGDNVTVHS
ncbi:unnamed protein product [Eruca vesicaria subsp. sativa]|uniref:Uncharacterized protein n=1 Tax=Eruca vesicaria subsp. sativa TaxID=29727 RepID=A0ABC8IZE0_ERUVS|nr:unnamed protein product [Eruca vesicaria subsp. sativa]